MPVDKKYLMIGVASLAVTALVIGLSVGLTQKNKHNNKTYDAVIAPLQSEPTTHKSSRVSSQQQLVTVASGRSSCDGTSLRIDLVTDNYGCVSYYVFNDTSKSNTLFSLSL